MYNRLLRPISTRSFALAVLGLVVILGLVIALWLVLNQSQLTFHFQRIEGLRFLSATCPSNSSAVMTVRNTGTSALTIVGVTMNNIAKTPTYGSSFETDGTLVPGANGTITIGNWTWTNGYTYEFVVYSATGNKFVCTFAATPGGSVPTPIPYPERAYAVPDSRIVDFSPLIVASLIAVIELAGVIALKRKRYLHNASAPARAVLGILMILGLVVTLWLVVSFLFPPLTF